MIGASNVSKALNEFYFETFHFSLCTQCNDMPARVELERSMVLYVVIEMDLEKPENDIIGKFIVKGRAAKNLQL